MIREFRFKRSCQDTGEVKVDCRIALFCGETLPDRRQAETLQTNYSVSIDGSDFLNMLTQLQNDTAGP